MVSLPQLNPWIELRKTETKRSTILQSTVNVGMTLDRTKPVSFCSMQELVAALMLQEWFNNFDPDQVLADLNAHAELWLILGTSGCSAISWDWLTPSVAGMDNDIVEA